MNVVTASKKYFERINRIRYEGCESDNPLAFRWYDENKMVAGKSMKKWLRFACAYWHSFCWKRRRSIWRSPHIFFHGARKPTQ